MLQAFFSLIFKVSHVCLELYLLTSRLLLSWLGFVCGFSVWVFCSLQTGNRRVSKRKLSSPLFPSAASLHAIKPHLFSSCSLTVWFSIFPLCWRVGLNTVQKTVVRRRSYAKGEAEMLTELAELEFKTAAKSARKGKLWNTEKQP